MNNRSKAIEEMAKIINEMPKRNAHYYAKDKGEIIQIEAFADCFAIAEELYNAGYKQPINDDECVINKEEYEKLKKHYLFMQDYTIVEVLEKECEKAIKETAREILQEVKTILQKDTKLMQAYEFAQLAEKYGVEVE